MHPSRSAEPDPTAAVRLSDVSFGHPGAPDVLRGVNHSLPRGSFHFVTGAAGSGKSSLLGLIAGHQVAHEGRIDVLGADIGPMSRSRFAALRHRIGVVPQQTETIDHLSVLDNTALPLRLAGRKPASYRDDVAEALAWVGLADRMSALPAALSASELRRMAVARAVVAGPDLILADEPTASVDDATADRLMQIFSALNRMGATILMATHDAARARAAGGVEWRLHDGALEARS